MRLPSGDTIRFILATAATAVAGYFCMAFIVGGIYGDDFVEGGIQNCKDHVTWFTTGEFPDSY